MGQVAECARAMPSGREEKANCWMTHLHCALCLGRGGRLCLFPSRTSLAHKHTLWSTRRQPTRRPLQSIPPPAPYPSRSSTAAARLHPFTQHSLHPSSRSSLLPHAQLHHVAEPFDSRLGAARRVPRRQRHRRLSLQGHQQLDDLRPVVDLYGRAGHDHGRRRLPAGYALESYLHIAVRATGR